MFGVLRLLNRGRHLKVLIVFCNSWGYDREAFRVRDYLIEKFEANVSLQEGTGGVFDVFVDQELRFSIFKTGCFPTEEHLHALGV